MQNMIKIQELKSFMNVSLEFNGLRCSMTPSLQAWHSPSNACTISDFFPSFALDSISETSFELQESPNKVLEKVP